MKREIPLNQIKFNNAIYPRDHLYYQVAYRYASALRSGVKFPPIVVGRIKENAKNYYLVDGWHRLKAHEMAGKSTIEAEIKEYKTFSEAFYDAVKLNATHGQPLTAYETTKIIKKLRDEGKDWVFIASLLNITIEDAKKMLEKRTVEIEKGEIEVVKKPIVSVKERIATREVVQNVKSLTGVSQEKLLKDLRDILRSGLLDIENRKVVKLLIEVYDLLTPIVRTIRRNS